MQKILIATGNPGKKKEMLECFGDLKQEIEFLSLKDFPDINEPIEDGTTFQANAIIKAYHYAKAFNVPTIGEDSGILINAYPDQFGVQTRRTIEAKDDMGWLTVFLEMMNDVDDKSAEFFSALAFVDPVQDIEEVFVGNIKGEIVDFPQAPLEPGVPISAVFIPEREDEVFSAMTKQKKNSISHRGWAAAKFCKWLQSQ